MDWPTFSRELLSAPAEDWEGVPNCGIIAPCTAASADDMDKTTKSASLLLESLEETFATARSSEDRAKALETMQTFLAVRRVRLVEDMVMLSLSLGEGRNASVSSAGDGSELSSSTVTTPTASLRALRRDLSVARANLPVIGVEGTQAREQNMSVLSEHNAAEQGLAQSAAGMGTFFSTWADQFGRLIVPLRNDSLGGDDGAGSSDTGRGSRKDDREIQAARDIERDTLVVNGVLVVGREGYSAVVGRVEREFRRLVEPVTGVELPGVWLPTSGETSEASTDVARSSRIEEGPLRPSEQLENFSKLVLKAANRTESGGLSFDAINRIMSLCPETCDGSVLVVPDSSKAEPLGITIAAEGFQDAGDTPFGPQGRFPELQEGVHAFGICARVEAVTVYSLYSVDMETVYLKLRATFRNCVRLPLSPFSDRLCHTFSDVGYRGEAGEVEIVVLEGPSATDLR